MRVIAEVLHGGVEMIPGGVGTGGVVIEKDQIYEYADAREGGRQIRIESYQPGDARAHIVSHPSGKNPRQILVKDLHDTPTTPAGQRRQRGYFLVTETGPTPNR